MDEWLSHRSAKPSTAVRIRFGPHSFKKHLCKSSIYEGVFLFTHKFTHAFLTLLADVIRISDLKVAEISPIWRINLTKKRLFLSYFDENSPLYHFTLTLGMSLQRVV